MVALSGYGSARRTGRTVAALALACALGLAGCGGDSDEGTGTAGTTAPSTVATDTTDRAGTVASDDGEAEPAGDLCDQYDIASEGDRRASRSANRLAPEQDCDPTSGEFILVGGKCQGEGRSGTLGHLHCRPSRLCGGYQWSTQRKGRPEPVPCEPSGQRTGQPIAPLAKGQPCEPGEPLPYPFVCKKVR